jgi:hypothetical protein
MKNLISTFPQHSFSFFLVLGHYTMESLNNVAVVALIIRMPSYNPMFFTFRLRQIAVTGHYMSYRNHCWILFVGSAHLYVTVYL